jgi:hypothetical protein
MQKLWTVTGLPACLVLLPLVSMAVDTDDDPAAASLDPDYAAGKRAIEAKDWSAAIKLLSFRGPARHSQRGHSELS